MRVCWHLFEFEVPLGLAFAVSRRLREWVAQERLSLKRAVFGPFLHGDDVDTVRLDETAKEDITENIEMSWGNR